MKKYVFESKNKLQWCLFSTHATGSFLASFPSEFPAPFDAAVAIRSIWLAMNWERPLIFRIITY